MKFSSIIAAGLAAVATAAPAVKQERSAFNFNGGVQAFDVFGNDDLTYLLFNNNLNLDIISQLSLNNNLDLFAFQGLFQQNALFDLQNVLLLQQLIDIQNFAQVGLLGGFDLGGFGLQGLDFGLQGLGGLGLGQFIPSSALGGIQQVISQQVTTFVAKE